ncbi:MAG: hypothetical protein ACXWQR_00235 [Ktedonobacterales bacterium]
MIWGMHTTKEQDTVDLIQTLEAEYDLDSGFLGRLREGTFDAAGLDRLIAILKSIEPSNEEVINRRLVALLWMIPTLMEWQVERIAEHGGDAKQLERGISEVQGILMDSVLGTP